MSEVLWYGVNGKFFKFGAAFTRRRAAVSHLTLRR